MLTKGYCFGNAFALALYNRATTGVAFTGKVATPHGGAAPAASVLLSYRHKDLLVKDTIESAGPIKVNVEYVPPKTKDLTLFAEASYQKGVMAGSASVQQLFSQARYKFTASNALVFGLSLVAGQTDKGVGLDLGYSVTDKIFTKYDALAYLHTGDTRLALKHVSKPAAAPRLGGLAFSMFQQVKPKLAVAGKVAYDNAAEQKLTWEGGFRLEMTPNRSVGAKVNSDLTVSFRSRQKLWEYVTLVYSIRRSKDKAGLDAGFKLKINL